MSAQNVISIDDHRPHLTVQGIESVHVVPVSLIRDIIDGKGGEFTVEEYAARKDLIRGIVREWFETIVGDK
jgi:uncharacterized protein (DUF779 family)